jgi:hypothetical protein
MPRVSGRKASRSTMPLLWATDRSPQRIHSRWTLPAAVMARRLLCAGGVIAGFQFNRQYLSDAGIADMLVGSAEDRFELTGMVSGRGTRLPREPFIGAGEALERRRPGPGGCDGESAPARVLRCPRARR